MDDIKSRQEYDDLFYQVTPLQKQRRKWCEKDHSYYDSIEDTEEYKKVIGRVEFMLRIRFMWLISKVPCEAIRRLCIA